MLSQLRRERGSVSIEAAFGIGSMLAVSSLLVQGLMAMLVYLQALGVSTEAAAIASASGRLSKQVIAAERWACSQLPRAQVIVDASELEVRVTVVQSLDLLGGAWRPTFRASSTALIVDRLAWTP